jgi:hypothetical protein
LNIVTWYEAYSFLDGYSGHHQISISPEDKYKIITNWEAFVWMVMQFGDAPPSSFIDSTTNPR